jgi:hypothetical protein
MAGEVNSRALDSESVAARTLDPASTPVDDIERVFDYGGVTALPAAERIQELQQRVHRMQGAGVTRTLDSLPALGEAIRLKTGGAYAVDSPSLAMALMAGPSLAGEWSAVVGIPEFGWEAAAGFGLALERTIVVPNPGEHWLSVTAGLADVVSVVLVRPAGQVTDAQAERLRSRLRLKDAALLCWGGWPRCDAEVTVSASCWTGLGQGHGHLRGRAVEVSVRRGGAPARRTSLWLPGTDQQVTVRRGAETAPAPLTAVRAG